eukprot:TRINITY_DN32431_c0_g2_i1.p1 TRINITY_DN32431_c0_g2~~TRINITY_DN32431_c0_g2_i1.p1  ORF type:complete len:306 (-),score=65.76 TRINITY_DN32431_c0_g2_i1:139-1056(-)
MGGSSSVSWTPDADSPEVSGEKCILSSPIEHESVNPEKFLQAFERTVRTRGPMGMEQTYRVEDMADGGILAIAKCDAGDAGEFDAFHKFYFKKATDEIACHNFVNDETKAESSKTNISRLKLHRDPHFHLEFYIEELGNRRYGPIVKAKLQNVLSNLSNQVKIEMGADSPSGGGKCVLSDPITDPAVTADTYLDWARQQLVDLGAEEQADGSLTKDFGGLLGSSSFHKFVFDKEKKQVIETHFGEDSSMSESSVDETTTTQVHSDPFRVEMFAIHKPGRSAGSDKVNQISYITDMVIKDIIDAES